LRELRHTILVQPKLEFSALQPGARASEAIRQAARDLGLTPEKGVRVRLTGSVPLADEEFGTLADGALRNALLTVLAVALLLWLGLRSGNSTKTWTANSNSMTITGGSALPVHWPNPSGRCGKPSPRPSIWKRGSPNASWVSGPSVPHCVSSSATVRPPPFEGEVLAYEPESLVEFQWGTDVIRLELVPTDAGSVLTLLDTIDDLGKAARDGAGWHICLEALRQHLAGQDSIGTVPRRWQEVHAGYVDRFGPEAATMGPTGRDVGPFDWNRAHDRGKLRAMPLDGEYEPSPAEWVRTQVQEYESSGGTSGTTLRDMPVIILTTKGARSGKIRSPR